MPNECLVWPRAPCLVKPVGESLVRMHFLDRTNPGCQYQVETGTGSSWGTRTVGLKKRINFLVWFLHCLRLLMLLFYTERVPRKPTSQAPTVHRQHLPHRPVFYSYFRQHSRPFCSGHSLSMHSSDRLKYMNNLDTSYQPVVYLMMVKFVGTVTGNDLDVLTSTS